MEFDRAYGPPSYYEDKLFVVFPRSDTERTGRLCHGLELDPLYVDTIARRWQAFTGMKARHAMTGKSFGELEKEAGEHDAK